MAYPPLRKPLLRIAAGLTMLGCLSVMVTQNYRASLNRMISAGNNVT